MLLLMVLVVFWLRMCIKIYKRWIVKLQECIETLEKDIRRYQRIISFLLDILTPFEAAFQGFILSLKHAFKNAKNCIILFFKPKKNNMLQGIKKSAL